MEVSRSLTGTSERTWRSMILGSAPRPRSRGEMWQTGVCAAGMESSVAVVWRGAPRPGFQNVWAKRGRLSEDECRPHFHSDEAAQFQSGFRFQALQLSEPLLVRAGAFENRLVFAYAITVFFV